MDLQAEDKVQNNTNVFVLVHFEISNFYSFNSRGIFTFLVGVLHSLFLIVAKVLQVLDIVTCDSKQFYSTVFFFCSLQQFKVIEVHAWKQ